MPDIIVAGAGHGGLTAACNLARNGCKVTVYEKKPREELGYDWVDCMTHSVFNESGVPMPAKSGFLPFVYPGYYSPSKGTLITPSDGFTGGSLYYVERKFLINHLVESCIREGVEFVFGAEVTGCVTDGGRVTGVKVSLPGDDSGSEIYADLIIDAAGIDSPVRRSLPANLGIQNDVSPEETFYVYRACYERSAAGSLDPVYCNYFYHCGHRGMDWLICEPEYIDVLIGQIGSLDSAEIDESLSDFRRSYDFIGEKLVRGGTVEKIPLRRPLSLFVADGYALVGDSACMTEPLSGSGINMSLKAGKILSDVITERFCEDFSAENLWRYQYKFFKNVGERYYNDAIINRVAFSLEESDLEALMRDGVLTAKEIYGESGVNALNDAVNKIRGIAGERQLIPKLVRAGMAMAKLSGLKKAIPNVYDSEKIAAWRESYDKILSL